MGISGFLTKSDITLNQTVNHSSNNSTVLSIMNSRLQDVVSSWSEDAGSVERDVELQTQQQPLRSDRFYREIDAINHDIASISKATKEIAKINDKVMSALTGRAESKASSQLRRVVEATNAIAKRAKDRIERLHNVVLAEKDLSKDAEQR